MARTISKAAHKRMTKEAAVLLAELVAARSTALKALSVMPPVDRLHRTGIDSPVRPVLTRYFLARRFYHQNRNLLAESRVVPYATRHYVGREICEERP